MAKVSDTGLIEHDPLAWLDGGNEELTPTVNAEATGSLTDSSEEPCEDAADSNLVLVELAVSPELAGVSQLHEQLKEALDKHRTIEIDASKVESIDTSTLQLLLILKRESVNLHKTVVFKAPSESFIRSAKHLDLDELMGPG